MVRVWIQVGNGSMLAIDEEATGAKIGRVPRSIDHRNSAAMHRSPGIDAPIERGVCATNRCFVASQQHCHGIFTVF
jgi:hypothetical protein